MGWGLIRLFVVLTGDWIIRFIGSDLRRIWLAWGVLLCLWALLLAGTAGLVRLLSRRRVPVRTVLAWIFIQELIVSPVWLWILDGTVFGAPLSEIRLMLGALGLGLAVLLHSPIRLPEWLFPLRGKWLRSFLATLALLGLAQIGPWWVGTEMFWTESASSSGVPLHWWLPFLLGAIFFLFSLGLAATVIGERAPEARRRQALAGE
jgi:hypothetical protein